MAGDPKLRDSERELKAKVNLLWIADSGKLEGIECPECKEESISVRFTNPVDGVYRTWFVCSKCKFRLRAQNSVRPKYFSDELVDEDLQKYDVEVIRKKRLF